MIWNRLDNCLKVFTNFYQLTVRRLKRKQCHFTTKLHQRVTNAQKNLIKFCYSKKILLGKKLTNCNEYMYFKNIFKQKRYFPSQYIFLWVNFNVSFCAACRIYDIHVVCFHFTNFILLVYLISKHYFVAIFCTLCCASIIFLCL